MEVESSAAMAVMADGWWVPIVGVILTALSTMITYYVKKFISTMLNKIKASEAEREAMQLLLEGMAKAQEEFVREAKKAAADGKLTKDEINRAKDMAIAHAVTIAKGPALDLLKTTSKDRLGSWVKQLLAKLRK